MPAFENRIHKDPKYNYLGGDQKKIAIAVNAYITRIKEHPPHVTGWLKGKIDLPRMLKLKKEIEEVDRFTSIKTE